MKISTLPNRNPWFSSHNHLSIKSRKKTQAVEYRLNLDIWKLDMKLPLTWSCNSKLFNYFDLPIRYWNRCANVIFLFIIHLVKYCVFCSCVYLLFIRRFLSLILLSFKYYTINFFLPTSVSLSCKFTEKWYLFIYERSYLSMYYYTLIMY
jgi:hypothetical protein